VSPVPQRWGRRGQAVAPSDPAMSAPRRGPMLCRIDQINASFVMIECEKAVHKEKAVIGIGRTVHSCAAAERLQFVSEYPM
jgi:hypothetical protein